MRITCCKDCVAPKRHPGCHDHCEEYKNQKEKFKAQKEKAKEFAHPVIRSYDFNKIGYGNQRHYKR